MVRIILGFGEITQKGCRALRGVRLSSDRSTQRRDDHEIHFQICVYFLDDIATYPSKKT
jgi:hypothetical protein